MRGDVLERLRRVNPVPETMSSLPIESVLRRLDDAPRTAPGRPRLRRSVERLAVGVSVLLVLAVAGLAIVLLGNQRHAAKPSAAPSHKPWAAASPPALPDVQSAPLKQLLASFSVFRRSQTKADRSLGSAGALLEFAERRGVRVLRNLTRRVATLGGGAPLFLVVTQAGSTQRGHTARRSSLSFLLANPHGAERLSASYFPVLLRAGVWASVVPDGVARVQWTMSSSSGCRAHHPTSLACRWFPVDLSVRSNVAVVRPPVVIGCALAACRAIKATRVAWYDASGKIIATLPTVTKPGHIASAATPQDAGQKAQAIRYDLQHAHRADPSLLAAFAVFRITSRTGVKTAAGNIISRPPLSSVPLDVLQGGLWLHPLFQLDPTQLREVITPAGVRLYVIPGRRALCLATADGGASCNLLPSVESHGIYMALGSLGTRTTYRILPRTMPNITISTSGGKRTIRVPDGIYVSPAQRTSTAH